MSEFVTWLIVWTLGVSVGVACTILVHREWLRRKSSGTIKIDLSDPDGPFMFLVLKENIPSVIDKKSVLLDVEVLDDIPHK